MGVEWRRKGKENDVMGEKRKNEEGVFSGEVWRRAEKIREGGRSADKCGDSGEGRRMTEKCGEGWRTAQKSGEGGEVRDWLRRKEKG